MLDAYLRDRAKKNGAQVYNGLFLRSSQKDGPEGAFTVNFSDYTDGGKVCSMRVHDSHEQLQTHSLCVSRIDKSRNSRLTVKQTDCAGG